MENGMGASHVCKEYKYTTACSFLHPTTCQLVISQITERELQKPDR